MRRADRLFDIIQRLRTAKRPVTATALARTLEVSLRTVYRDIATLQARRVPIEGEPGIGYELRRGFDLPPLMFTSEEIEAVAVGVRMIARTGDRSLQQAADSVLSKVAVVLPHVLRDHLTGVPVFVSPSGAPVPAEVDFAVVRQAIREQRKLRIAYADQKAVRSQRTIWPIAVAYYVEATLIGAWCELRTDFRNLRVDRIVRAEVLEARFQADNGRLLAQWLALQKERPPAAPAIAPA